MENETDTQKQMGAQNGAAKTDYTILEADNGSDLSSKVNNLLRHGWMPQGGVAITSGRDGAEEPSYEVWAQAMLKHY